MCYPIHAPNHARVTNTQNTYTHQTAYATHVVKTFLDDPPCVLLPLLLLLPVLPLCINGCRPSLYVRPLLCIKSCEGEHGDCGEFPPPFGFGGKEPDDCGEFPPPYGLGGPPFGFGGNEPEDCGEFPPWKFAYWRVLLLPAVSPPSVRICVLSYVPNSRCLFLVSSESELVSTRMSAP